MFDFSFVLWIIGRNGGEPPCRMLRVGHPCLQTSSDSSELFRSQNEACDLMLSILVPLTFELLRGTYLMAQNQRVCWTSCPVVSTSDSLEGCLEMARTWQRTSGIIKEWSHWIFIQGISFPSKMHHASDLSIAPKMLEDSGERKCVLVARCCAHCPFAGVVFAGVVYLHMPQKTM